FNTRLSSTITPTMINEFRFQFGREFARSFVGDLTPGEEALAGTATSLFSGLLPQISISGANAFQFGTSINFQPNAFPKERTLKFGDTFTSTWGNHTFKIGTDIKFTKDDIDNLRGGAGGYAYNNVQDLISDLANPSGKTYTSYQQGFGLAAYTLKTP